MLNYDDIIMKSGSTRGSAVFVWLSTYNDVMGYKYSVHTDRKRKKESTRCFSWSKIKQQQKKTLRIEQQTEIYYWLNISIFNA